MKEKTHQQIFSRQEICAVCVVHFEKRRGNRELHWSNFN